MDALVLKMNAPELKIKDKPSILSIPAGQSFADALAQGLLERTADDPLALSAYTILLPNRRAARTLREAFLRLTGGKAVILPRMQPIGDVDADEVSLLLSGAGAAPDVPPAISPLERQLLLARTVMRVGDVKSFDQAAALALELGRFLDEVQGERLDFENLKGIVPDAFAGHWQKTLEFLKILTHHWPAILQERGVIDQVERRNRLLALQAEIWTRHPPQDPVIAAGSTGTAPAVAELLEVVARLPQGMIILPGLDTVMEDDGWAGLGEDHPQYNLKRLLDRLGVGRHEVRPWALEHKMPANLARVRLLSEALRPAATTDRWRNLTDADITPAALQGFSRIDCDTPQEEADVIALLLREALETPGKTAALVTPDRRLARRVTLALRRWGVAIDDSGGQPLTDLPVGAFLMLTAEMAEEGLSPVTLLSVLKHPLIAAAMAPEELRAMVYLLDRLALRGPRPSPGLEGLRAAIERLEGDEAGGPKAALLEFLSKIGPRMEEFISAMAGRREMPFRALLSLHVRIAEALAATEDAPGAQRLWRNEAGEAAAETLSALLAAAADVPDLLPSHYVPLLGTILKSVTVRPRHGMHPRLSILGQVEARLYCADVVILGGLNEGTWPAMPPHDPWMSRPMRKAFGLPSPDRSISLAAHDFFHAGAAAEVYLTRARKVDGTPTVPARWLLRLETVLKAVGLAWDESVPARYRQWVRDMDAPARAPKPAPRPAPMPPVSARPRGLSVTQVEAWMRDPYQIYARKILGLSKLDPLDADPGGAERGTFIHAALEDFIRAFPEDLPQDAAAQLLAFGRAALLRERVPQEVEAFWWPRFEKIAGIFVEQERAWRREAKPLATEISGALRLGDFTLSGKADRIDRLHDGSCAIIDYKSGFTPENPDVALGLSPQLPLEALMLEKGAFEETGAAKTGVLLYWRVTGSGQKPVEQKRVEPKGVAVEQLVREAEDGLLRLIATFNDEKTPYLSQPRAGSRARYSDYDHLARVREWSVSGDGEDAA